MAIIKGRMKELFDKRDESRQSHTTAGYCFTLNGILIETYGSADREFKGVASQSMLFSGESLEQLEQLIKEFKEKKGKYY